MEIPTIILKSGKCRRCRKKGFVGQSGLCIKCAGKLAVERVKKQKLEVGK